ncbi:hypothetical protein GZ78_28325 [Endozoicomonas numazuensis]|uniref:Uncharacterized protein n=1 Tax=Endozoicomonas numazuensis TaxID=1137799 RepID=A0A081MZZ1_9GAMM|nr:hypothetical protein GZ78_28325 [Endozoicomonas numazuensis]
MPLPAQEIRVWQLGLCRPNEHRGKKIFLFLRDEKDFKLNYELLANLNEKNSKIQHDRHI